MTTSSVENASSSDDGSQESDGDTYLVDYIMEGPRSSDGKYLVKWEGYPASEATWEPRSNLPQLALDEFFDEGSSSADDDNETGMLNNPPPPPTETPPGTNDLVRRQGRGGRRIPGVHVAARVDSLSGALKEPSKPPKVTKGMGKDAVVAVQGRFLYPPEPLKHTNINDYRITTYQMVVQRWGRKAIKGENAYVLLLTPGARHDGTPIAGKDFYCRFSHAKMDQRYFNF